MLLRNDSWMEHWARRPGVIVGLDASSVAAARKFAEMHPSVVFAEDLDSAVRYVEPLGGRPPEDESPCAVLAHPSTRRHLVEVDALDVSDAQLRAAHSMVDEAIGRLAAGDEVAAVDGLRQDISHIDDERLRADVLGDVAWWALHRGLSTPLVYDGYEAELVTADAALHRDDATAAAASYMEALRTAFHPAVHMHHTYSPLAEAPDRFTAPLRSSAVARRIRQGRLSTAASAAGRATGGPRLLFAAHTDDQFLKPVLDHFSALPGVQTRFKTFSQTEALERFGRRQAPLVAQLLAGGAELPAALESTFRTHLDAADVAFVEWSSALAALLSHMPHPNTRVIVRLHSWEAFSFWPHLINYANIDDLVFVSEPMRDFAVAALPALAEPGSPRLHVIPNSMDLQRFALPKPQGARFTVGVVGASRVVKDPLWALDVVRRLREVDERYRLRLIRGQIEDEGPAAARYIAALKDAIRSLPDGVVDITPHTDRLPEALQEVGTVISSSVRESFHIGLVEAVASGALPVVRDWPYLPGAAERIFPSDWVVQSAAAAAERILAETSDPGRWQKARDSAATHAVSTWDWSAVHSLYDNLLLGDWASE